jgi:hypothetical protein
MSFHKHALLCLIVLLLLIIQRPPEKHNVWLWTMNGIVNPTTALLNSYGTPLILYD